MSPEMITLIWLVAGLVLCGSELVVPGLITIFLGLGALGVALLRWLGLVESLPLSFLIWVVSSAGLILAMRKTAASWISKPETSTADIDERSAEFGQEVEVLSDVNENNAEGRIRFQGTSWPATTTEGTLKKGDTARIVYRENVSYVVEPIKEPKLLDGESDAAKVPTKTESHQEVG